MEVWLAGVWGLLRVFKISEKGCMNKCSQSFTLNSVNFCEFRFFASLHCWFVPDFEIKINWSIICIILAPTNVIDFDRFNLTTIVFDWFDIFWSVTVDRNHLSVDFGRFWSIFSYPHNHQLGPLFNISKLCMSVLVNWVHFWRLRPL